MFNNLNKPGKGVYKDEPEKRGVFLFFELFFRKFWNYCGINILYFVCLIPFIFGSLVLYYSMDPVILPVAAAPLLLGISIITPGFVYILRNYSWERHSWVIGDYFRNIKINLLQALLLFVLDCIVVFILYNNILFYIAFELENGFNIVLAVLNASLALIYLMMHMYIYVIMVTFKMRFFDILKNALILTFAKFPVNFILIVLAVWTGILVVLIPYGFGLAAAGVVALSFIGLMLTFYPSKVIKRYMMKEKEQEGGEDKLVFDDKIK